MFSLLKENLTLNIFCEEEIFIFSMLLLARWDECNANKMQKCAELALGKLI